MGNLIKYNDDWEFNVIGIYNYNKPGVFDAFFDFIRENHDAIEGDIVESGVYRGKSLLATALFLKELGSDKKVYGYDSFSGFPPEKNPKDDFDQFDRLKKAGKISQEHYDKIMHNLNLRQESSAQKISSHTISTSGDFSSTSLEYLKGKISLLNLDNIILCPGDFAQTMKPDQQGPKQVMAVMMDCDLYQSYIDTFQFTWPKLSSGGMVFLDEYYSLKFPGARIATDEFLEDKDAQMHLASNHKGDFERWIAIKT